MLAEVADNCLKGGLQYVCTVGKEAEFIHDFFDNAIIKRRVERGLPTESPNDFEYEPSTSWHDDFDEAVFFAIYNAYSEHVETEKVVFLNMTTNDKLETVREALEKLSI